MAAHSLRDVPSSWQGLVAGAIGGFIASWAMEQCQQRLSHLAGDGTDRAQRATGRPEAWDARSQDQVSGQRSSATERAADAGAKLTGQPPLDDDVRAAAAQALHYAFGTVVGAAYGAMAETDPGVTRLGGLAFGIGVWAGADELSMALLGFAPPPERRPPLAHVYSVISHLVYGATTEAVRRGVRAAMPHSSMSALTTT